MTSKTSRLAKKKSAATPEQRKAMTFTAVNLPFNWTNDDWGLTFLPRVRAATISLQRDDKALEKFMADIVKDGMAPELLDGWIRTRDHLKGLVEVCVSRSNDHLSCWNVLATTPKRSCRKQRCTEGGAHCLVFRYRPSVHCGGPFDHKGNW